MGKFESRRENAEVEKTFRQVTGTPAPKKGAPPPRRSAAQRAAEKKKKMLFLIIVCSAVLTLLIGSIIGLIIYKSRPAGEETIHGGVYAGSLNLGGMTLDEAKNALHLATDDTFTKKDMIIKLPDGNIALSPADTHAKLDVDAVVQAAFDYGRTGTSSNIIPLLPYLSLDLDYIQGIIQDFCDTHGSVMVQPTVTITGDRPAFDAEHPDLEVEHQTLTIVMGVPEYALDAEEMYNQVLEAYSMNEFTVGYRAPQQKEPEIPNAQAIFDEHCSAPQDAVQDPDTLDITPEVYGYGFDVAALQKRIDDAEYGQTITLTLEFLTPDITTETFNGGIIAEILAETTLTSGTQDDARDSNILKACEKLNGLKIKPGAIFSFNDTVGALTLRNGFKEAPISPYNGSAMGGGVSQVASALYRCALLADLKITQRTAHSYTTDFGELGLDAFVDGAGADLCFRNNTDNVIDITAVYSEGAVSVKLMGVSNLDYTIQLTPIMDEELAPNTIYQQMAPDNVMGYEDGHILQEGITGYRIIVQVQMLDKESGEVLNAVDIRTNYLSVDEIVVKIDSGEDVGGDAGGDEGSDIGDETGEDITVPSEEIPSEV